MQKAKVAHRTPARIRLKVDDRLSGLAVHTGINSGAVLAGESAFALGYVAFDLYWKFQQKNVVRKIEKGLSQQSKDSLQ